MIWQQPSMKVSLIRWAQGSAAERYFCWKMPPGGAPERRKCLSWAVLGSPGTGSLPPAEHVPLGEQDGGRLGLIAEGAAFFLSLS